MAFFVTTDTSNLITGLYTDDGDFADPPVGAVQVTIADFALLRSGRGKYKFINGVLVDNLDLARRLQTRQIEAAYVNAIGVIASQYPETERNSWAKQEQEARAWIADNTALTPLLSALTSARGDTLSVIAGKVITNADAYAVYAGAIIGKRQALLKQVDNATTKAGIESIVWG